MEIHVSSSEYDPIEERAQQLADQGVYTLGTAERVVRGTEAGDLLVPTTSILENRSQAHKVKPKPPLPSSACERDALLAGVNVGADTDSAEESIPRPMSDATRAEMKALRLGLARQKVATALNAGDIPEAIRQAAIHEARKSHDGTGTRVSRPHIRTSQQVRQWPQNSALSHDHVTDATRPE